MNSPFYRWFVSTASPFGGRQWAKASGLLLGFRLKTPAHAAARTLKGSLIRGGDGPQVEEQQRPRLEPYIISSQIVEENKRAGFKFFDPNTMRCFGSRVLEDVCDGPAGVYFVTSEKEPASGERWYKVRRFEPSTGRVVTVTSCPQFSTPARAKTAAAKLSRGLAWDAKAGKR